MSNNSTRQTPRGNLPAPLHGIYTPRTTQGRRIQDSPKRQPRTTQRSSTRRARSKGQVMILPVSGLECLRRWRTEAKRALQPNWPPIDSSPEHAKPRRSRAELAEAGQVSGPSGAARQSVSIQHAQTQARTRHQGPQRRTERLRRSTRFCKSLTKLAEEPRGPFTLPV